MDNDTDAEAFGRQRRGGDVSARAFFTGSFDPFTKGHLDIVERASRVFDEIIITICANTEKSTGMFTPDERLAIADASVAGSEILRGKNVKSEICPSLLAGFIGEHGGGVIIRGSRGGGEFEYESAMADVNRALAGIDTVIFPATPEIAYISSTVARDMLLYGRPEIALCDGAAALAAEILKNRK